MKILITGFAPFGGETINPSYEAVRLLPETIGEHRITKLELPVTFEGTPALLAEKVRALNPDVLISVGQAGGRPDITLERVAINLMDARIPDNDGYSPEDIPVEKDGETAYFATASREKNDGSHERSRDFHQPFLLRRLYVCNTVMYAGLYLATHELVLRPACPSPFSPGTTRRKERRHASHGALHDCKRAGNRHQGPVNKEIPEKPFLTWSSGIFFLLFLNIQISHALQADGQETEVL